MKKILKIALIVILIIVLVVGGYFIALNMIKKQAMDTVDKMFTALKTGIAHLTRPYDNDFLNQNFKLEMLAPNDGKEDVYNAYMKKMILGKIDGKTVYRNFAD